MRGARCQPSTNTFFIFAHASPALACRRSRVCTSSSTRSPSPQPPSGTTTSSSLTGPPPSWLPGTRRKAASIASASSDVTGPPPSWLPGTRVQANNSLTSMHPSRRPSRVLATPSSWGRLGDTPLLPRHRTEQEPELSRSVPRYIPPGEGSECRHAAILSQSCPRARTQVIDQQLVFSPAPRDNQAVAKRLAFWQVDAEPVAIAAVASSCADRSASHSGVRLL